MIHQRYKKKLMNDVDSLEECYFKYFISLGNLCNSALLVISDSVNRKHYRNIVL